MKKILLLLMVGFFLTLFKPIGAAAEENINNFLSEIAINKDGTINVVETIIYDFGIEERHGIYRDIPFIKINKEGKKFKLDIKVLSVNDENKKTYNYTVTQKESDISIKIGSANAYVSGIKTYVINYKVAGALTYFSDHDELYWNATGNDWEVPIKQTKTLVSLPQTVETANLKQACFADYKGGANANCKTQVSQEGGEFSSELLLPGQGLTIVFGFPKNIVAVLEPKEQIDFFTTPLGKIIAVVGLISLGIILLLWYVIYPFWLPFKWYFHGRDPKIGGPVRAWFDPPKTKEGRPLTPAETGALVDESVHLKDILAMVVDLARRGYIKIIEVKKGEFNLEKIKEGDKNLLPFEKTFLEYLFEDKTQISLKKEDLRITVTKAEEDIYTSLVKNGFFPENPSKTRNFYAVIAGLASATFNPLLVITSLIFGRSMAKKTILGAREANVGLSLKNFLVSQERQLEFQAKNQMFFEKLLPYAVAFGVEKIWIDRFKDINIKSPDWYEGKSSFSTGAFYNSFHSSFASQFNSSATPTRSSSGFSSGFSGGGSSGGGGGGGGGSW